MLTDQTVYVIDDEEGIRDSIRMMLERRGYEVAVLTSAEQFLVEFDARVTGCIVSDVRLEGLSGLDLQKRLNDLESTVPLILITGHGDIEMAVSALKRGAFDFIEKPFDDARLYDSVATALSVCRDAKSKQAEVETLRCRIGELSERQRQVMDLLVEGLSNKEIGRRLGISPRTVETYRAFVMAKTGAGSLAELVKLALRAGLTV